MKLAHLISLFEKKYPRRIAENWDNVGLLVGDKDKDINKVLVCLDVTSYAIEKAIEYGVDLIMSHHPLIFSPLKRVTMSDPNGIKITRLIEEKIAVYAAHTNLDSAKEGLNDFVWKKLDLLSKEIYTEETVNRPIRYYELNDTINIRDLAMHIKENLSIENVRVVHNSYYTSNRIKRIAMVTGSGMDFLEEVKDKVDCFITADIKHHQALDALEYGVSLIDFGHYDSEKFSIDLINHFLEENTDLEVKCFYSGEILERI